MTRIDEIVSNALAGIEEAEVAILARELLKTREALALALQARGVAEGRAALADRRAVSGRPRWVADVSAELDRARTKFPKPDLLTTAFAEEAGELVKAILDGYNGKSSDVYGEAIQAIAMVVRLIEEGDPVHRLTPRVVISGAPSHLSSLGPVDRFAACPNNEPCSPIGCDAGEGRWPRCPTEVGTAKAPVTNFPDQAYTSIETAKLRELEALQELLAQARCAVHAVEDNGECDMTGICNAVFACDSLRANQGVLNHVHV